MNRLVVGILAHVDAGKTTLSEGMLYFAGNIKKLGRVDHKDAFLDTFEMERERGITIFSKQAVIEYNDITIALLDTPGHVDFSAEMERTLQVLDCAILVVSAAAGVQGHTVTLWNLLKRYKIPVFIFVNKMDITDKDRQELIGELKKQLNTDCIDFSDNTSEEFYENVAMCDEKLLDSYLESGTVEDDKIKELIKSRKLFPCYFGSALKFEGIDKFMGGVYKYADRPKYGDKFKAKVYKISRDEQGTRLTNMKVTGGSISVKEMVDSSGEKIEQIRIYSGAKYQRADMVQAGMVCAVTGLSGTYAGQCLGDEDEVSMPVLEPVMTFAVLPEKGTDIHKLLSNMKLLEEEEPQLHIVWNEKHQEINVQLMGEVQTSVLKRIIWDRFHTEVEFGSGSIVYKETIKNKVEGIGHFEPLKHYAEVHLLIEPGEPDSGIVAVSGCGEDELDRNWQRLIITHIEEKEHIGVLTGAAVTDIKITLLAGRAHLKHTEGGDFRQAVYRAIRQGLMQAESVLLEPYYDFRLEVPADCIGRAMTDIQRMNGSFNNPEADGEISILTGEAPVSEIAGYPIEVSAYTAGKGRILLNFKGYQPCHEQEQIIEKTGYNPEEDLENPAGSVFCAHGSGFYVPWYDVPKFMHIERKYNGEEDNPDNNNFETDYSKKKDFDLKNNKGNIVYNGTIEEDKELEAIFERTFGKISRRLNSETRGKFGTEKSKKTQDKGYKKRKPYVPLKEYLLVDGYNIIFSWEELNELSNVGLEAARYKLMDILCNYQGFKQCEVILVFDAYKVKGNPGQVIRYHNINVVYTKEAETADMYIEKVTHEIGKKHNVTVATSDALEQLIVAGEGAKRMSAREFNEEIERISERIKEIIENGP